MWRPGNDSDSDHIMQAPQMCQLVSLKNPTRLPVRRENSDPPASPKREQKTTGLYLTMVCRWSCRGWRRRIVQISTKQLGLPKREYRTSNFLAFLPFHAVHFCSEALCWVAWGKEVVSRVVRTSNPCDVCQRVLYFFRTQTYKNYSFQKAEKIVLKMWEV